MKDRILVVDDDPDILQFVEMNLDMEGFDAQTAESGRVALEVARQRPPDLILLDVMMPELDGLTVLRRLRSSPATSSIPVVLLTAKALAEDRVRGLDLGADDYITKPFDIEELMARVKAVLRRAQQMRDLSPLTGLPGNFRISRELETRVTEGGEFAIVHADLDNFKSITTASCGETRLSSSPPRCCSTRQRPAKTPRYLSAMSAVTTLSQSLIRPSSRSSASRSSRYSTRGFWTSTTLPMRCRGISR